MIQKYSPKNIITKVEWNALENKIKKKKKGFRQIMKNNY